MKNNKLKIGLQGCLTLLLANLSIGQNGRKKKTFKKNQIEITIWFQFKVLTAIFFHEVYFTISK